MALADPLTLGTLANLVRVADTKFVLDFDQERSKAGGVPRYADLGPAGWRAEVTSVDMEHWEAEGLMAVLNSRAGGLRTMLLYNYKLPFPIDDPDGSLYGSATPVVGTITDRSTVAFTGFPANYVLRKGTYFRILFDGGTRRYLGQFAEDRTASGVGAVSAVTVAPALPASVAPGDSVSVSRPAGKFKLVPGSAYPSMSDVLHSRITFAAEQTYEP